VKFSEMIDLLRWDWRVNHGLSFDCLRAKLLLLDVRVEQYIYRKFYRQSGLFSFVWYLVRLFGSVFQWFLCNSNIPGTITIGRGLRLPHPQNIILAGYAEIGEFCTIYHNVSFAWNGFLPTKPFSPRIGNCVLVGAGALIVGDLTIGSYVLIGAGSVISKSVPEHMRVTSVRPEISTRLLSSEAAEPGSSKHIKDPYSIWR
jgi:serine O-acetyltransferase